MPQLSNYLTNWQRYVDDTITFMKEDHVNDVLAVLNSHHKDINFTHTKWKKKTSYHS